MLTSLKQLLFAIADYAGLFPPAQLDLSEALTLYTRAQTSPESWMLDRFILPASRLSELTALLSSSKPEKYASQALSLSVILSKNWVAELEQIQPLINNSEQKQIVIHSLEVAPLPPDEIQQFCEQRPADVTTFFEIPFVAALEPYINILQQTQTAAKLRTGGLTSDAFPSSDQLSQRILAFADAQISFKATAGLHHPLRGQYALQPPETEESPHATPMHGFLNLALLAAFAYQKSLTPDEAQSLLEESTIAHFRFTDTEIAWRDRVLSLSNIEHSRQNFFRSFGSCSFQEPVDDLHHLGLL